MLARNAGILDLHLISKVWSQYETTEGTTEDAATHHLGKKQEKWGRLIKL